MKRLMGIDLLPVIKYLGGVTLFLLLLVLGLRVLGANTLIIIGIVTSMMFLIGWVCYKAGYANGIADEQAYTER